MNWLVEHVALADDEGKAMDRAALGVGVDGPSDQPTNDNAVAEDA
jgi:hypothetical protein